MKVLTFSGQGRRTGRVHVFDEETGAYLTRGFVKGTMLYVKREIDKRRVVLRQFEGRRQTARASAPRH